MPKVEGLRRRANQAIVAGSSSTIARPPRRKSATSSSLPGFASKRTSNATLVMGGLLEELSIQLETTPSEPADSPPAKIRCSLAAMVRREADSGQPENV